MRFIIDKHFITSLKIPIVFVTLIPILYGCAATKPNLSIIDEKYMPPPAGQRNDNFTAAKFILDDISSDNKLLATELGRLPELQDGVSMKEKHALKVITQYYTMHQHLMDKAFGEMYQVGLPEVRKYCSPLQALFWLAEDCEFDNKSDILKDYSLKKLLDKAWKLDRRFSYVMSDSEIKEVINSIIPEEKQGRYLKYQQQNINAEMQSLFIMEYKRHETIFGKKAESIIRRAMAEKNPRWEDFGIVVERLNGPELIDYYERKKFHYVDWRTLPTPSVSPWYVFTYNKGECVSITAFSIHCLQRGGYKAQELRVSSYSGLYAFHAVCLFEMNGRKYIMDNGQPVGAGIIPYEKFMKRF